MKKVMIYAYTQFNLGDDLFIQILCRRYPKVLFYIYAQPKYKILFSNIENLRVISNTSLFRRIINFVALKVLNIKNFSLKYRARLCDASVQIGGSLFMESKDWKTHYHEAVKNKFENQPFFLLGSNFGPFNDNEFYLKYKSLFETYEDVCFRDTYSYNLFRKMKNVRQADDIIFQLESNKKSHKKNAITFSIIKPSSKQHSKITEIEYYHKIKEMVIYFLSLGYDINLVSFCELEGDEEAIEKIWDSIPLEFLPKVTKHYYRGEINNTLQILQESELIVATRFHSMILAWLFNVQVLPVIYNSKMSKVIEDVNYQGLVIDIEDIKNWEISNLENIFQQKKLNVTKQIGNSQSHFKILDQFLL